MKYYFQLQLKIYDRTIRHFGISPYFAYPLIFISFFGLSFLLWEKTDLSIYFYGLAAASIIINFNSIEKLNFMRSTYDLNTFYQIRFTEHLILIAPFVIFLLIKGLYFYALLFLTISLLNSFVITAGFKSYTIPTPFGHYLHEYTTGYRRWLPLYIVVYFLLYQSVQVSNFNLGMAAMAINFLIGMSFYQDAEGKYFVWSHAMTAHEFLLRKAKAAYLYSAVSSLPIPLALIIFNSSQLLIILGFFLFMGLFPVMMSQAKYCNYPKEINLPNTILLSICFIFPPAVIVLIFYFYRQSINHLQKILE
jgi:hypothetical protein